VAISESEIFGAISATSTHRCIWNQRRMVALPLTSHLLIKDVKIEIKDVKTEMTLKALVRKQ
jgi:hypothetical protein